MRKKKVSKTGLSLLLAGTFLTSGATGAQADPAGVAAVTKAASALRAHLYTQCKLNYTRHQLTERSPAFRQLAAVWLFTQDETFFSQTLERVTCPKDISPQHVVVGTLSLATAKRHDRETN